MPSLSRRVFALLVTPLLLAALSSGCRNTAPVIPPALAGPLPIQARAVPVRIAVVQSVPLQEQVKILGTVTATRKTLVAAEVGGQVLSVLPHEGDRVQRGEVLIRLEDTDARMRVAQAEGDALLAAKLAEEQVQTAQAHESRARTELILTTKSVEAGIAVAQARLAASEARLRLLKAGPRPQELARAQADYAVATTLVTRAENSLAYAQRTHDRKLLLLKKGFISQQEADTAELNVSQAQVSLEAQRNQLRALEQTVNILKAGPRPEEVEQAEAEVREARENVHSAQSAAGQIEQKRQDVAVAQAELRQARQSLVAMQWKETAQGGVSGGMNPARARVELAREAYRKTTIHAPLTGIVTLRRVEPGESVVAGSPLLEIVDPGSLYVEATLADREALKVRVGQSVEIAVQALPAQRFTGKVAEVVPPTASQGQGFRVKVLLDHSSTLLRSGMITTGSVHLGKQPAAMVLPVAALLADSPEAMEGDVYVVEKERVRRHHLRLGLRVGEQAEVVSGLNVGDRVVIEGQTLLVDGQKVTLPLP